MAIIFDQYFCSRDHIRFYRVRVQLMICYNMGDIIIGLIDIDTMHCCMNHLLFPHSLSKSNFILPQ